MPDTTTATTDNQREFWVEYYAGLMKQAKDLQEQRAAVLQQAAVVKRYWMDRKPVVSTTVESVLCDCGDKE